MVEISASYQHAAMITIPYAITSDVHRNGNVEFGNHNFDIVKFHIFR